MADTLYLVDTFSLVFQVFHAIRQPMTGTRGQPTNAVFGFTGDLQHILKDKKPTHLIVAMESPEPGERLEIYPEYKANRDEMPDELRPQIPMVLEVAEGYGIPIVSCPGWEADDVIATLAKQAEADGFEVRIVSSDKDMRQLITSKVKMYSIRKKRFMDEAALAEDWGIRPDQVIDFQSLVGDSVDNVPGVPGVGPKRAQQLLEKFETLEGVLANADQAPGKKLAENLKTYADQALMSRELVTLRTDLDLDFDWEQARVHEPDYQKLFDLFTDLGFRRYANEMQTHLMESKMQESGDHKREWTTIQDTQAFETFLADLKKQRAFCFDLETSSKDPLKADIVGWAFSWEKDHSYYVPVNAPMGANFLKPDDVLTALKPLLEDSEIIKVNQNVKYEMLVLRRAGVELRGLGLDPMIGDYLLDAGARTHGLDDLSKKYLFRRMIPISDLIGKGKKQLQMFEVDVDQTAEYASEDADVTWQVTRIIEDKLKSEQLWDLYWDLERPLIPVLAEMEWNGVRVNTDELKRQSDSLVGRLDALVAEIHDMAGVDFNIDSPKQLAKVLFEDLGLKAGKRTKTGYSTDQDTLEKLAAEHPLPAKLIEHRQLSKLKGTYLDALPELVNPKTGNVHTSFSQTTAATGRLSSSDPNLQNIPIRSEEGRLIRKAFIPSRENWKLVCLDYSQIELRMLAHFCRDDALMDAFRNGEDIHASVAEELGVERSVAKAVNFGVIYGQTAWGLAASLRISKEEAFEFIDSYFERYPGVQAFVDATLEETRNTGFAKTILGRRREITGVRSKRYRNLNLPERTAVNTVIQGSAADLIKKAMIDVYDALKSSDLTARMLLQIHDELVFEAPAEETEPLIELAVSHMETALQLDVPIVVDRKVGENWYDAD